MSQQVITMKVGTLELRKTEAGWEYLSEGVAGDPELWCDAAGALSPFSGTGVNSLLDELAATKLYQSARESELEEVLGYIRGKSNCCDAWDAIDEVIPYNAALYG